MKASNPGTISSTKPTTVAESCISRRPKRMTEPMVARGVYLQSPRRQARLARSRLNSRQRAQHQQIGGEGRSRRTGFRGCGFPRPETAVAPVPGRRRVWGLREMPSNAVCSGLEALHQLMLQIERVGQQTQRRGQNTSGASAKRDDRPVAGHVMNGVGEIDEAAFESCRGHCESRLASATERDKGLAIGLFAELAARTTSGKTFCRARRPML